MRNIRGAGDDFGMRFRFERQANPILRAVIDKLPSMIAFWDNDLRCRFANKAYVEWFGRTPESMLGIRIMDLLGPDLFATNEVHIRGALAGQPQTFERTLTKADGSTGYALANYIPEIGERGEVEGFFVLVSDITPLKQTADRLRTAESRLRAVVDNVMDGIITIDSDGVIVSVNPATVSLFGYQTEELVGQRIGMLMPKSDRDPVDDRIWNRRSIGGIEWPGGVQQLHGITKDERCFPMELRVAEVDMPGEKMFVGLVRDVTEQKRIQDDLTTMAMTDALTGLVNRRRFDEQLRAEYAQHRRSGEELSLMLIDVDHFKMFNDTYGHLAGDQCLREIAQAISRNVKRGRDVSARYGGEEFACILPMTDQNSAVRVAEKIRGTVIDLAIPHRHSTTADCVTVSIGVATARCIDDRPAVSILTEADAQLYEAKSAGRNRHCAALLDWDG